MQNIETKVIDWQECKNGPWYPTLSNGGYDAYRIWQRFDGLSWLQRHEWKAANGSTEMDQWIKGVSGWLPSSSPVVEQDAA